MIRSSAGSRIGTLAKCSDRPECHQTKHSALYSVSQVRELDRRAIASGIEGFALMSRAGEYAYRVINQNWPDAAKWVVVCGTGNNGGDGWIVARLAHQAGLSVSVCLIGDPARIQGDAARARDSFVAIGGDVHEDATVFQQADILVDALLGIGFSGTLRTRHTEVINLINAALAPVVSLDVPSGLNADSGTAQPTAVRAQCTVTFIADKRGLHTGDANDYCGAIVLAELDLPPTLYADLPPCAQKLDWSQLRGVLGRRRSNSHKGTFGHVLIIGGRAGLGGAAVLAAEGALRNGAGKVSMIAHSTAVQAALVRCPEIMAVAAGDESELNRLLALADVVVVGPGLGLDDWATQVLHRCLSSAQALVLDADALTILARSGPATMRLPTGSVLTPHPGEAARLLNTSTLDIAHDRFTAAQTLAKQWQAVTLLKGAGSLVASPDHTMPVSVCPYGNPGMATGGMGDVLSGMIGALLAQDLDPYTAVNVGVCAHAKTADRVARARGERSLLPTDVLAALRE